MEYRKLLIVIVALLSAAPAFSQSRDNKVVLLMPFCNRLTLDNPNNTNVQLSNLSREYYQGALLAVDSLEKQRIRLTLTVLDSENDSVTTVNLLKKPAMRDCDLIIGPIMQGGNRVVSNFVKGKNILHVSPLMTLSKTKFSDPNLISPNPNLLLYPKFICQKIKETNGGGDVSVIIISDKSSLDKTITAAFKQLQTQQKGLKLKVVDYAGAFDLKAVLQAGQMNHIVVPSSSEPVVNRILKNIGDTALLSHITFYGFPQWLDFKNPDYRVWERANVRITTPFFVDYEREEVKHFIKSYRERYYTEPTEAAFKGYDQLLFLCGALDASGPKMLQKSDETPVIMLGSTFNFKKQEDKSGYQNTYLHFVGVRELKWTIF